MNVRKKLLMAGAALALPLGTVAMLSQAASAGVPPVTGTGDVTCSGVAGKVSFATPLSATGPTTGSNVITVKLNLKGCNAGGATNVTSSNFVGKINGTITTNNGTNCGALAGPSTENATLPIKWTAKDGKAHLNDSALSLTQIDGLAIGTISPTAGFAFGDGTVPDGTGTGSFAGNAKGEIDSNLPSVTVSGKSVLGLCASAKGLSKLAITFANVTMGPDVA